VTPMEVEKRGSCTTKKKGGRMGLCKRTRDLRCFLSYVEKGGGYVSDARGI